MRSSLNRREAGATAAPAGIVLVGNPNVGKSALFGALTGKYVTVSNYPGTTVEVSRGHAVIAGRRVAVVDTPGAASFVPTSEDERVTRDILLEETGARRRRRRGREEPRAHAPPRASRSRRWRFPSSSA